MFPFKEIDIARVNIYGIGLKHCWETQMLYMLEPGTYTSMYDVPYIYLDTVT